MADAVRGRFTSLEQQVEQALRGDESARNALLDDATLPAELTSLLRQGDPREQVRQELAQSLAQIEAALAGNETAREAVLRDPVIPAEIKNLVNDPPAAAAARLQAPA